MARSIQHGEPWSPFVVAASALGVLAVVLMAANLILNALAVLVAATALVVAIWGVATVHHMTESTPRPALQA
jgi:hypothetical protein